MYYNNINNSDRLNYILDLLEHHEILSNIDDTFLINYIRYLLFKIQIQEDTIYSLMKAAAGS